MRAHLLLAFSAVLPGMAFAQLAAPPEMNGATTTTITQKTTTISAPTDDIGYDAKVKRDPNGNVITNSKADNNSLGEYKNLRTDNNLRSDKATFAGRNGPPPAPQQQPSPMFNNGTTKVNGKVVTLPAPGSQLSPANSYPGNQ